MHDRERFHDLDALRAFMMFLGVLLHGIVPYTEKPVPFWPVHDSETSGLMDLSMVVIHDFRMQTFFLLAGFFGALLHRRYGLKGMLKHRMLRVAMPFAIGLIVLIPILQYFWIVGDPAALKTIQKQLGKPDQPAPDVWEFYSSGRFLRSIFPFHMWFLYFLCIFYLAMVPLVWLGKTGIGDPLRRIQAKLLTRWYGLPVLALILVPLLWPMKMLIVDTPDGWGLTWHLTLYYFVFFGFGWLLFDQRHLLPEATRRWRLFFLLACVVLVAYLAGLWNCLPLLKPGGPDPELDLTEWKAISQVSGSFFTWLMVFFWIGLFRRYFDCKRELVRYLADSAYWCYLVSLIPLIALQMVAARFDWPLPLKLLFVNGIGIALLLASYEWCVRYSFIGAMLNGRKTRRTSGT